MLGKTEGRRRKGTTGDEMDGWHHQLDGHEFEQALGVGDGQGSLACCSPWGQRVRHKGVTELNFPKAISLFSAETLQATREWHNIL